MKVPGETLRSPLSRRNDTNGAWPGSGAVAPPEVAISGALAAAGERRGGDETHDAAEPGAAVALLMGCPLAHRGGEANVVATLTADHPLEVAQPEIEIPGLRRPRGQARPLARDLPDHGAEHGAKPALGGIAQAGGGTLLAHI